MKKLILLFALALANTIIAQWKPEGLVVADSSVSVGDFYPYTITDSRGGSYIVWQDFRNHTDLNIYVQRLDSSGREIFEHNGIPVTEAPNHQQLNLCTADGKGGIFFTWADSRDIVHQYIYAQHMDSSGNILWQTDGVKISDEEGGSAQVVLDGSGGIIINYVDYVKDNLIVQRIDSAGNRMWGESGIPNSNNGFVNYLHSATDGKGGIIVSWIVNADSAIYAQRFRHDGSVAWNPDRIRVSVVDTEYSTIRMIDYDKGGAIICWSTGTNVEVRAQKVDSTGNILWGDNGVFVSYGGLGGRNLVINQNGEIIIPIGNPQQGLKLFRLKSNGTHTWQGGISVTSLYIDQWDILSDCSSGVIVAYNASYNTSSYLDMYAQRIDSNSVARWKEDGVAITNYNGEPKFRPTAVSDGKGGVIAAWLDNRPNFGVYAGKVDSEGNVVTGILRENDFVTPENLFLYQNYPNPFNPTTIIHYQLPIRTFVKINVYDLLGREITSLVNEEQSAGKHSISFDAQSLPSGIYFYRLTAGSQTITKKMVIIH